MIANVHPNSYSERWSLRSCPQNVRTQCVGYPGWSGHHDDPSCARRVARLGRRRGVKEFAYVHVAPDLEMMSRVYSEASVGCFPPSRAGRRPAAAIDPSRAPEGKHILWVQVRVLPAEIRGDAKGEIASMTWDDAKEAYAERVLDILEAYAPGLSRLVLARSVWSPLDLERENPNLIGGDNLSGSHHLDQNFFLRPVAGYSRYHTPVKGLYLSGVVLARRGNRRGLRFHARGMSKSIVRTGRGGKGGRHADRLYRRRAGRALFRSADETPKSEHQITVVERNKPYDTFGWGVVFSDAMMQAMRGADPESAQEIADAFNHWDDIELIFKGRVSARPDTASSALDASDCLTSCSAAVRARRRARVRA